MYCQNQSISIIIVSSLDPCFVSANNAIALRTAMANVLNCHSSLRRSLQTPDFTFMLSIQKGTQAQHQQPKKQSNPAVKRAMVPVSELVEVVI